MKTLLLLVAALAVISASHHSIHDRFKSNHHYLQDFEDHLVVVHGLDPVHEAIRDEANEHLEEEKDLNNKLHELAKDREHEKDMQKALLRKQVEEIKKDQEQKRHFEHEMAKKALAEKLHDQEVKQDW